MIKVYLLFDKELLNEEYQMALQQDEYTRKILSFCIASDEMAAKLLTDGDVDQLAKLLDNGQLGELQALVTARGMNVKIPIELKNVCGIPSFIQVLEGNIKALAISKLKILVRAINPAVENEMAGYDSEREEGGDPHE